MSRKISLHIILIYTILATPVSAQEMVTGLKTNYKIAEAAEKHRAIKGSLTDTISLPFFDDFSGGSVLPDSTKWLDDYVFINNTYSDKQITSGIATFDAIDNTGALYPAASSSVFEADYLTSLPLDLNYQASDSLRLSFFYQPGGLADKPETGDSLILQFYAPGDDKWYHAWKAPSVTNTGFECVIIRIDQGRFLKKGFMFRFINYASINADLQESSLISNCDEWNIDYVMLDKNRSDFDTVFSDVAFTRPVRSLLQNHEAMPWNQFSEIENMEMDAYIKTHYRNNDTIIRNITRNFEIWDVYNDALSGSGSFSAGATNIDPLTDIDYPADLTYTYNTSNSDSALFRVTCSLVTDEFDPKKNDTMVYYQVFNNYFAFDDGSSEGGYGITGQGASNAMVAYKFKSYIQDTIRAVQIYFNNSYDNSNEESFDLMVWDDNSGVPGDVIYTREDVTVSRNDIINDFTTYLITKIVPVNSTFYVGWKQLSETFLNAGFDVNTLPEERQFYWLNGQWYQSSVSGSIMIRPVMGSPLTTSVKDILYEERNLVKVWPNPAKNLINIDCDNLILTGSYYISIVNIQGNEIMKQQLSETIDISSLHEGIYLIIITLDSKPVSYNRIIKTK